MVKEHQKSYENQQAKDGEDKSESYALDFFAATTQILTVMCLVKGNSAWKGSLALLFIGAAAKLWYKYKSYNEKPYLYGCIGTCIIGLSLLIWFGFSG